MNCMSTQHFLILGFSIFLVKGLSDVGILDESKSITINHSPGFTRKYHSLDSEIF